jgi:hypothetical protein
MLQQTKQHLISEHNMAFDFFSVSDLVQLKRTEDKLDHFDAIGLRQDGSQVMVELRARQRYTYSDIVRYGGLFLNCHKAWNLVHYARSCRRDAIFVASFKDCIGVKKMYKNNTDEQLISNLDIQNPKRNQSRGDDRNDSCFAYKIPEMTTVTLPKVIYPEYVETWTFEKP